MWGSSFFHISDKVQHVGKHQADASFDVASNLSSALSKPVSLGKV